jgi:hypothetical protein
LNGVPHNILLDLQLLLPDSEQRVLMQLDELLVPDVSVLLLDDDGQRVSFALLVNRFPQQVLFPVFLLRVLHFGSPTVHPLHLLQVRFRNQTSFHLQALQLLYVFFFLQFLYVFFLDFQSTFFFLLSFPYYFYVFK